jgi:hypothetical protein
MSVKRPKVDFFAYATYDKNGTINGVTRDAPQEVKDAYKEFIDKYKSALAAGKKL